MYFEFAPLEGVTTYLFRTAYHRHFTPADRYFTPFVAPNMNQGLNPKERRDVLPENNPGLNLVPQVLTNRTDYFLSTCRELADMGYTEVNLNLGCPSGTVVAKNKGAGFLSEVEALERFLDEIFEQSPLKISIKTRIGRYSDEEWPRLLALYQKYPLTELIIHPRIQKDYYKNIPRRAAFELALDNSPFPVTYNGDLFSRADIDAFSAACPDANRVMLGRGLICNPWLTGGTPNIHDLEQFHGELYEGYLQIMYGDGPTLCKMKGVWVYLIQSFTNYEKYWKIIRKTRHLNEYTSTVNALFHNEDWVPNTRYSPEK